MPTYYIKTVVHYEYDVEADNEEEAEKQGWMYEDYPYAASVEDIRVEEQDEPEEYEEEKDSDEVETEDE
jgi:hypothetical protein